MSGFGSFLKDYLEFYNISQSDFAIRLGISQKHMNEIVNGKAPITAELAANLSRLTGIDASFIINVENDKKLKEIILKDLGSEKAVDKMLKESFSLNELKKRGWVRFLDITSPLQNYLDILKFLRIKDLSIIPALEKQVLFKKNGEDFNKLALWIAHCDEISVNQEVNYYDKCNLPFLVQDINNYAYHDLFDVEDVRKILNNYGFYFACEKALSGTKVRGCFKVKGLKPTIYITDNYSGKDSFFFELLHEVGHCKSDYNEAKSKTIFESTIEKEERADKFAINSMINEDDWNQILGTDLSEKELLKISKKRKIPMCYIVGRLAKFKKITYYSELYKKYDKV